MVSQRSRVLLVCSMNVFLSLSEQQINMHSIGLSAVQTYVQTEARRNRRKCILLVWCFSICGLLNCQNTFGHNLLICLFVSLYSELLNTDVQKLFPITVYVLVSVNFLFKFSRPIDSLFNVILLLNVFRFYSLAHKADPNRMNHYFLKYL